MLLRAHPVLTNVITKDRNCPEHDTEYYRMVCAWVEVTWKPFHSEGFQPSCPPKLDRQHHPRYSSPSTQQSVPQNTTDNKHAYDKESCYRHVCEIYGFIENMNKTNIIKIKIPCPYVWLAYVWMYRKTFKRSPLPDSFGAMYLFILLSFVSVTQSHIP